MARAAAIALPSVPSAAFESAKKYKPRDIKKKHRSEDRDGVFACYGRMKSGKGIYLFACQRGDERNVLRRGTAAAAKSPNAAIRELLHLLGERLRADEIARFAVLKHRQARVWLHHERLCRAGGKAREQCIELLRTYAAIAAERVHGGGFAGTIQALVPLDLTEAYQAEMERVLGAGCCYRFAVRPVGGVKIG